MSKYAMRFMRERLDTFSRNEVGSSLRHFLIEAVAYRTRHDEPCDCGLAELARRAGCSDRSAERYVSKAVELCILKSEPSHRGSGGGRGRTFNRLAIVGFNDTTQREQTAILADCSPRITRQSVVTNPPICRDQTAILSGAYRERDSTKENDNSPPTPLSEARRRCESDVFEGLISVIRTPPRESVIETLIAPLLRQRRFDAPDAVFALGELADQASRLPADVLAVVRDGLLAARKAVVKASDLEDAVRAAIERQARAEEIERGPLIWLNSDAGREALSRIKAIDPCEAETCRGRGFIRRDRLQKILARHEVAA